MSTPLAVALAAAFTGHQLDRIANYLTPRAREARATHRLDDEEALSKLADAVTAARELEDTTADEPEIRRRLQEAVRKIATEMYEDPYSVNTSWAEQLMELVRDGDETGRAGS